MENWKEQLVIEDESLLSVDLPKWPALVVVGEPVTEEQAREICIRTDRLYFSSNAREFNKMAACYLYGKDPSKVKEFSTVTGLFKSSCEDANWEDYINAIRRVERELSLLELSYLHNSRIASSWVGGPHGWCNWDGHIGCNNYNIGKWPSIEEVCIDWIQIAEAFPFLNLKSQLFSHETAEVGESGEEEPVVQFNICAGKVELIRPKELLTKTEDIDYDTFVLRLSNTDYELGCTLQQFKDAVDQVRLDRFIQKVQRQIPNLG
jgi:hypothetical protein